MRTQTLYSRRPRWWPLTVLLVAIFIAGCGSGSGAVATSSRAAGPLVHLPADAGNHPAVRNEWWYVVGHLKDGTHTFGYEMTVFRLDHLRPPHFPTPIDILRTDVAISDVTGGRFHQKISYYFPQSAALSSTRLSVRVGNASLVGTGASSMTLTARLPRGALHLRLTSLRPAMDVGGRGYLPFGNSFTYYYSLTDLTSAGTVTIGGHTYHTTGTSWLDHQWGNWSWQSIRGWTWMALQLNNGVQLSVFDFRGTHRVKLASVLDSSGKVHTARDLTFTPTGSWLSPHTHARYPSGWIVNIPSLHARLVVRPSLRDQELYAPGQLAGSYWEGAGTIHGSWAGHTVAGQSYTELTGYAGSFAG